MPSGPSWLLWAVYFPMGLVGAAFAHLTRGSVLSPDTPPWLSAFTPYPGAVGLVLALVLAFVTIASTRILVARTAWARDLHLTLRSALLGTPASRVLWLALLSATSEELLFRAALLPKLGLFVSSLLFGALHVSPRGAYLAWAAWAALMGGLLGALYLASGSLLAPLIAHALINYENMQYIIHYDPTPLGSDRVR